MNWDQKMWLKTRDHGMWLVTWSQEVWLVCGGQPVFWKTKKGFLLVFLFVQVGSSGNVFKLTALYSLECLILGLNHF